MSSASLPIEYVEARRVLLDVLDALLDHVPALVLVGAQAVYLRCEGRLPGYQAFTTDADVVLDLSKLGPIPPLGEAMKASGFVLTDEPGIWEARFERPGFADPMVVPVDLIVPERLAPKEGRRAARLPDEHGKTTARKTPGLEGAVVDNNPILIRSFDETDARTALLNVAGCGALLVAKAHKLGERLDRPQRLKPKDAGDVYRLYDSADPDVMAALLKKLLDDERSSATTEVALTYLRQLFGTSRAPGHELAVQALRGTLPEETVSAVITSYTRQLLQLLDQPSSSSA